MARLHFVQKARGNSKSEDGGRGCGKCGARIMPGDSYYWWANRLPGSRSGTRNNRCANCRPSLAEMTPGRAGQLMALQEDAESTLGSLRDDATEVGQYETAAAEIAATVEELAGEIREAGENLESGFEHPTEQSENLINCADELDSQAQELEGLSFEDPPEQDEEEKIEAAAGEADDAPSPEESEQRMQEEHDQEMETWRDECSQQIEDIVQSLELTY